MFYGAFLLAICTLSLHALAQQYSDFPNSLTLSQFMKILNTEAVEQFEFSKDEQSAEFHWSKSISFQWKLALDAQQFESKRLPFLLCNANPAKSGIARKVQVLGWLGKDRRALR